MESESLQSQLDSIESDVAGAEANVAEEQQAPVEQSNADIAEDLNRQEEAERLDQETRQKIFREEQEKHKALLEQRQVEMDFSERAQKMAQELYDDPIMEGVDEKDAKQICYNLGMLQSRANLSKEKARDLVVLIQSSTSP